MKKRLSLILFLSALFLLFSADIAAQTKQRVRFAKGASKTTVTGTVRGYAYRDYILTASAGQTISVELHGVKISPVFTIFRPDGENLESAMQRSEFTGELPTTGDYVIRVGMMRAAARRKNSSATYTLRISIQ